NTKRAEDKERISPTCEPHDCNNKRRRKRTAKSRAHEQNAVSIPDLASWKPSRKATGHGWECARFAHTKEKSCRKKNGEIPRNTRCHRERRPPDHNPRHHSARAHDIRKPATRYLKKRIRKCKHAEHPTDLNRAEPQFLANCRCSRRNAHTVDVRDD